VRGNFRTKSEAETVELGAELGRTLEPGTLVLLIGDLGAGKTTLAKGIAAGLGAADRDQVSSPSFTLIHEYGDPPKAYHVDLYRLDDARQAETLGLDELLDRNAVMIVEWGERFPELWPAERIEVELRTVSDQERQITVKDLTLPPVNSR
jgi:tRNA threonylcarbamoyladenosine biosynthesis protein TsaE